MKYERQQSAQGVTVSTSEFSGGGRRELHAVFVPDNAEADFAAQLAAVEGSVAELTSRLAAQGMAVAAKRLFVDDPINNSPTAHAADSSAAVVGQAPYGCRVVALVQYVEAESPARFTVVRGSYRECRHVYSPVDVSEGEAPVRALSEYIDWLAAHSLTLDANCLRTWFFVRDIDRNYRYTVHGRNLIFSGERLNRQTHFIASTGIGCETDSPRMPLIFEALTIAGLKPEQVRYIKAPEMLNETMDYGVAFERATALEYGDRRVVYVSGTASIDNRGEIVGRGDVKAQTARMCANIQALLAAAGADFGDVAHAVLYCRNLADVPAVTEALNPVLANVPTAIVKGAVCRPGWLVEMECMAIAPCRNDAFAPY